MTKADTIFIQLEKAFTVTEDRMNSVLDEYEGEFANEDMTEEQLSMLTAAVTTIISYMEKVTDTVADVGHRLRTGNV